MVKLISLNCIVDFSPEVLNIFFSFPPPRHHHIPVMERSTAQHTGNLTDPGGMEGRSIARLGRHKHTDTHTGGTLAHVHTHSHAPAHASLHVSADNSISFCCALPVETGRDPFPLSVSLVRTVYGVDLGLAGLMPRPPPLSPLPSPRPPLVPHSEGQYPSWFVAEQTSHCVYLSPGRGGALCCVGQSLCRPAWSAAERGPRCGGGLADLRR